jgi:hypothetical protein
MKLAKPKTVTVNITANISIATHTTTGSGQADESTFCRLFESEMQIEVTSAWDICNNNNTYKWTSKLIYALVTELEYQF